MKVKELAGNIDKLGMDSKSNAEIKTQLEQFARGDFSSIPFGEGGLRFKGIAPDDMKRTAKNALVLIDNDFGGDAKESVKLLERVKDSSLKDVDFNQLVEKGYAHKLIQLDHRDPEAFNRIINGKYPSPQALDQEIDAIPMSPNDAPPTPHVSQAFNSRPNRASLKTGEVIRIADVALDAGTGLKKAEVAHAGAKGQANNAAPSRINNPALMA